MDNDWKIEAAFFLGVALLLAAIAWGVSLENKSSVERDRIEACKSIKDETIRAQCIQGLRR